MSRKPGGLSSYWNLVSKAPTIFFKEILPSLRGGGGVTAGFLTGLFRRTNGIYGIGGNKPSGGMGLHLK